MREKTVFGFLGALAIVILFNLFLFGAGFGFSVPVAIIILNVYLYATRSTKATNVNLAIGCSILAGMFSIFFVLRDNDVVQFLNFNASVGFALVAAYHYHELNRFNFNVLSFISTPLHSLGRAVSNFFFMLSPDLWKTGRWSKEIVSYSVRGVLIALALVFVLMILLMQADPVFEQLISKGFNEAGVRLLLSAILFGGVISLVIRDHSNNETAIERQVSQAKSIELSFIAGSIASLFAVFIIIQFRYLFSSVGERELANVGIASLTYSEYVRKGFFELLLSATIASGVVLYALRSLHGLSGKAKQIAQILYSLLTIETALLLVSALKRVNLYTVEHGLTRARIFGIFFLAWLAIVLVWLMIRIVKKLTEKHSFSIIVPATVAAISLLSLINIDDVIVSRFPPTVNGEVDHYYATVLSDDAHAGWLVALEDVENTLIELEQKTELDTEDNRRLMWAQRTTVSLQEKTDRLVHQYGRIPEVIEWAPEGTPSAWLAKVREKRNESAFPEDIRASRRWTDQNISSYNAYRHVRQNLTRFKQLPAISNRLYELQNRVSESVQQNTPIDRTNTPPFMQ